jgi:hypothetical protein
MTLPTCNGTTKQKIIHAYTVLIIRKTLKVKKKTYLAKGKFWEKNSLPAASDKI